MLKPGRGWARFGPKFNRLPGEAKCKAGLICRCNATGSQCGQRPPGLPVARDRTNGSATGIQHLSSDADLAGIAIHDALPTGTVPQTYVLLGAEEVRDGSDVSGGGASHRFSVSVHSDSAGFSSAKLLAATLCDGLINAPLIMSRGHLVGLWFDRAKARRMADGSRRIDLRFRARVEDG